VIAATAREPVGEPPARPPDLRLLPAAGALWFVVLVGLQVGPAAGPAVGSVAAGGAGVVLVVAMLRGGRAAAALVAAAGCAMAGGLLIAAHTAAMREHPLRAAAERGAAATLQVVVRDDPRLLRATGPTARPGAAQVVVPATVEGAALAGQRWAGGGRILLIAPQPGWSALLPGQRATAEGLLAPATRRDLTVAVLRVRGAPHEVGLPVRAENPDKATDQRDPSTDRPRLHRRRPRSMISRRGFPTRLLDARPCTELADAACPLRGSQGRRDLAGAS
jgi:competence protein ComEC